MRIPIGISLIVGCAVSEFATLGRRRAWAALYGREIHRLGDRGNFVRSAGGWTLDDGDFRALGRELALLVESVEAVRPAGALPDWQPGAVVRLPFSKKICRDGEAVCSQALMALADSAMVIACSAAWNGYRPMSDDRPDHALPAAGDV